MNSTWCTEELAEPRESLPRDLQSFPHKLFPLHSLEIYYIYCLVLQSSFHFKFSFHYYSNSVKKLIYSEDPVFQDKELLKLGNQQYPKASLCPLITQNLQVLLHTDLTFSQRTEVSLPAAGIGKMGCMRTESQMPPLSKTATRKKPHGSHFIPQASSKEDNLSHPTESAVMATLFWEHGRKLH